MPVQPNYPGVYVQEQTSGVRTIAAVATSIALFVGRTEWGAYDKPVGCFSYSDFLRQFSSFSNLGDLARAVKLFFENGGIQCYVIRLQPAGNAAAAVTIDTIPGSALFVNARYAGAVGNSIRISVTYPVPDDGSFTIAVYLESSPGLQTGLESWTNISMVATDPTYLGSFVSSQWVTFITDGTARPAEGLYTLTGGSDGANPTIEDYQAAYQLADKYIDLFNLLVLPYDTAIAARNLWKDANAFCERRRAFLLMDPPSGTAGWNNNDLPAIITDMETIRAQLDPSSGSAIFYPDLMIQENGQELTIGPSGAIAGLTARIDSSRGVWKAAAGAEAAIHGITGLRNRLTDQQNGVLNAQGVNVIRVFPNGIVNWGARTNQGADTDAAEFKYIPVKRTALFIEESLLRGLQWVVFEPNSETTWGQIRLAAGAFMQQLFAQGAFQGSKPGDAYFVKCDKETTTQDDINLGIIHILVGFAPLKPAEFVVIRIQQVCGTKTA